MNPMLAIEDLRLNLSGREIFHIEKLAIPKGQVIALVGPNGSGKSSLLLTLALLQPATSGTIYFDGTAVNGGSPLNLRRRMALVFQEAMLLDTTVHRNLTIPLRIRGVPRDEAIERADKWLKRFQIDRLARRKARQLSGGEAQRTCLARAFAMEPEVLFLDEPFTALDYPTKKALLNDMGQILAGMSVTTLFVTHDYTEIPFLASEVAVLNNGRIVKYGTVREILGDDVVQRGMWAPWET